MEYLASPHLISPQTLSEKLEILTAGAKYDVACTSSGVDRSGSAGGIGNSVAAGICHSFSADGRCISLLKILMSNDCIYDCKYCANRRSNDIPRATFTPDEISTLTMEFYRRNYIEGLFLSSGIIETPDRTSELLYLTLHKLRNEKHFRGYIHVKCIPGTSEELIYRIGMLADRMSCNLELPSSESLSLLAPNKHRKTILTPMRRIQNHIKAQKNELSVYRTPTRFVPAGQSTQMVIGATPENDFQIMSVAENLYDKFELKRVFYSAFINVNQDSTLPDVPKDRILLREHRLYQADWLLRFYGFRTDELLDEEHPNFSRFFDPKCDWALKHLEYFPVEIMKADLSLLLRVPGIGVTGARRIVSARRNNMLDFACLKKLGVVLKRAVYFITCNGQMMYKTRIDEDYISRNLLFQKDPVRNKIESLQYKQLSLWEAQGFSPKADPDDFWMAAVGNQ